MSTDSQSTLQTRQAVLESNGNQSIQINSLSKTDKNHELECTNHDQLTKFT